MKAQLDMIQIVLTLLINVAGIVSIYWKLKIDVALIRQEAMQSKASDEELKKSIAEMWSRINTNSSELKKQAQDDLKSVSERVERLSEQVHKLAIEIAQMERPKS